MKISRSMPCALITPTVASPSKWRSALLLCLCLVGIHCNTSEAQQAEKKEDRGVAVIQDKDFESLPQSKKSSLQIGEQIAPPATGKSVFQLPLNSPPQTQSADHPNPKPENFDLLEESSGTRPDQESKVSSKQPESNVAKSNIPDSDSLSQNTKDKKSDGSLDKEPTTGSETVQDNSTDEETTTQAEEKQDEESTSSSWSVRNMTDRKSLPSTVQMIISVAAISLVPAILLMTTCFIRIVVVLGILRQAIGLQQLPPTQVTTALALMLTFLIMAPTWKQVKQDAIDPYSAEGSTMSWEEAWQKGVTPIKKFMWHQIERAENENDFWIFFDYLPQEERSHEPTSLEEIPLKVLLPAFMISELKVAFLIGVQVLLPFLILDIVVASLCNTMGLIMMPPTVVSLPLKLLLFVMVDGWNLIVTMLLESFSQVT